MTLGELNEAFKWYTKASEIDPLFKTALLKKHATICHIKLELYLEDQHFNLQKKLDELKDYQTFSDEWFQLSSKIEFEKSSRDRKDFTRKLYEQFVRNRTSTICDWNEVEADFKLECKEIPVFDFIRLNLILNSY